MLQSLKASADTLAASLKASDEDKKQEEARARTASVRAVVRAALAAMGDDEEKHASFKAAIKASDDEEMKKAMDEEEREARAARKAAAKASDEEEKRDAAAKPAMDHDKDMKARLDAIVAQNASLTARIRRYEARDAGEIITQMTALKAAVVPDLDQTEYRARLASMPFEALSSMYDERRDEVEALKAREARPAQEAPRPVFALAAKAAAPADDALVTMSELDRQMGGVA